MIGSVSSHVMGRSRLASLAPSGVTRAVLLALPLAGFWLLLAAPRLDFQ